MQLYGQIIHVRQAHGPYPLTIQLLLCIVYLANAGMLASKSYKDMKSLYQ